MGLWRREDANAALVKAESVKLKDGTTRNVLN